MRLRLYTEKAIWEEVEKRLYAEREKEELRQRLERFECEIRELRERVWCLEHPATMDPKGENINE